jgi:peptidoglycan hydrolase-like protein with peptidoglycan-binding domain
MWHGQLDDGRAMMTADDMTDDAAETTPVPRRRRRVLLVVAAVAVVAAAVTGGLLVVSSPGADAGGKDGAGAGAGVEVATAEVVRGDLSGIQQKPGSLSRPVGPVVAAGIDGTVTELPAPGTVLSSRSVLLRVDNMPVMAVEGALPQWRSFEVGMEDGPDVEQLERSLVAWGFLKGTANAHFDARTETAVKAWQKELGLPRTGALEKGRIQFVTGTFTVGELSVAVGDEAGGGTPVYTTARDERIVTVDLPVGSSLARVDGVVTVSLPTGGDAAGHVTAVGAPRDVDGKTLIPVTVSFDDPAAAGDLTDASVQVGFVTEVREGVLSVPVTALGAASDGGFVIEVVGAGPGSGADAGDEPRAGETPGAGTRLVPVEVGLFAGDRVEITGDVAEGDEVVVPA